MIRTGMSDACLRARYRAPQFFPPLLIATHGVYFAEAFGDLLRGNTISADSTVARPRASDQ